MTARQLGSNGPKRKSPTSYPDHVKDQAARRAGEVGAQQAAQEFGIPRRQLVHAWAKERGIDVPLHPSTAAITIAAGNAWDARREAFVGKLTDRADDLVDYLGAIVRGDTISAQADHGPELDEYGEPIGRKSRRASAGPSVKDVAIAMGIVVDKLQLLSGQATGRTESVRKAADPVKVKAAEDRLGKLVDLATKRAAEAG